MSEAQGKVRRPVWMEEHLQRGQGKQRLARGSRNAKDFHLESEQSQSC